jgi:predicted metal-dependent enzyme (double-stranded beta helix superfamily)
MTQTVETRGAALDAFVQDVRSGIEQASTMGELLRRVSAAMDSALKDPDLVAADQNGVVYRDADYLFQVNSGIQEPGSGGPPHDHGECWAVYGVHSGAINMTRYERLDDGSDGDHAELKLVKHLRVEAGGYDVIAPWEIHQVGNATDAPARSFIIRSRNLNEVWRNRFDLQNKTVKRVKAAGVRD